MLIGRRVKTLFSEDEAGAAIRTWYEGQIERVRADGGFVRYSDGEESWEQWPGGSDGPILEPEHAPDPKLAHKGLQKQKRPVAPNNKRPRSECQSSPTTQKSRNRSKEEANEPAPKRAMREMGSHKGQHSKSTGRKVGVSGRSLSSTWPSDGCSWL